jgi:hypothetical protein
MNDTPPEIERMVREKLMARSGEERFIMGALMFDAAREMVLASFPPDLPEDELKRRLFERIYGLPLDIEALSQTNR